MTLYYQSTRNPENRVTASQAILKGIAEDGGLYVPVEHPKLPVPLADLVGKSYQKVAFTVMKAYFDDFSQEELQQLVGNSLSTGAIGSLGISSHNRQSKKTGKTFYIFV